MDLIECNDLYTPEKMRHFWELARADFISKKIKKYLKNSENKELLDIGCGDCFLINKMSNILNLWNFTAIDSAFTDNNINDIHKIFTKKLELYSSINNENLFNKKFNAITMFDVLEHVENDYEMLIDMKNKVLKGGYIFITVPADKSLFGEHDVKLCHKRRYEKSEILNLSRKCDLKIIECNSFFFPLWFIRKLSLLFNIQLKQEVGNGAINPIFINNLLRAILNASNNVENIIPLKGLSLELICQVQ